LLVDNCVYSGLSQALWADGLFIRDLTRLDALEDGALRRMAMLLHDCYGSLDIAYRLLAEHDRRRGGDLAGRYLEGLRALGTAPRRAA
jgi:hypothetical protein